MKEPTIYIIMRPAGVAISMFAVIDRKPAPASAIRSMMYSMSFSDCDRRSGITEKHAAVCRRCSSHFQAFVDGHLRSSMLQTLAMPPHRLATNMVKYGALEQPKGQLAIA